MSTHNNEWVLCRILWSSLLSTESFSWSVPVDLPRCRLWWASIWNNMNLCVCQWCRSGKCVNKTPIPQHVDGDWSPWSQWSVCSRTCGTGVHFRQRKCDNPPYVTYICPFVCVFFCVLITTLPSISNHPLSFYLLGTRYLGQQFYTVFLSHQHLSTLQGNQRPSQTRQNILAYSVFWDITWGFLPILEINLYLGAWRRILMDVELFNWPIKGEGAAANL